MSLMDQLKDVHTFESLTRLDLDNMGFLDIDQQKKIFPMPDHLGVTPNSQHHCDEQIQKNPDACPNCGEENSITKDVCAGTIVCIGCGCVLEITTFDYSPEWKMNEDTSGNRCGNATNALLPQSSLSTTIGGRCSKHLKILHNWNAMPPRERSLNCVLQLISSKCSLAKLPRCIEDDAKLLYKIATDYKNPQTGASYIIRNKNRLGLVASCLFYACKRGKKNKSIKDVAALFNISSSCVNKGCKIFAHFTKYKKVDYSTNMSYPSQFICHLCDCLKLPNNAITFALQIAQKIEKFHLVSSHTPVSIAAACVKLCVDIKQLKDFDKEKIASVYGISVVTLMKTFTNLSKHTQKILDDIEQPQKLTSHMIPIPSFLLQRLEKLNSFDTSNLLQFDTLNFCNYLNNGPKNNFVSNVEKFIICINPYASKSKQAQQFIINASAFIKKYSGYYPT